MEQTKECGVCRAMSPRSGFTSRSRSSSDPVCLTCAESKECDACKARLSRSEFPEGCRRSKGGACSACVAAKLTGSLVQRCTECDEILDRTYFNTYYWKHRAALQRKGKRVYCTSCMPAKRREKSASEEEEGE